MYRIKTVNQNNICYKGKFIFAENLSQKERQAVDKFMNFVLNNKSNKDIVRSKTYDIYVQKCEFKPDMLKFFTSFKSVFSDKKRSVYISSLNLKNCVRGETGFFRSELKWFEKYKEIACGYNNPCEKISAFFKTLF